MRNILHGITACALALLFSCTNERGMDASIPEIVGDGDTQAVNFSIQLPTPAAGQIGIEGTEQENEIKNIMVLAFMVDETDPNNVKEYYIYKAQGNSIQDVSTSSHKRFNVNIFKKDFKQRFVLIANAYGAVSNIGSQDSLRLKEDLLDDLMFENNFAWYATSDTEFTYIPMWGESEAVVIDDSDININPIKMLRAVSRIDVWLTTDEAKDDFMLDEIYIYNHLNEGKVAPYFADSDVWDSDNYIVNKVSLPSSYTKYCDPFNVKAKTESGENYIPAAYVFEAPSVESGKSSDATCLVIGGRYQGESSTTYYRVDFFERNSENDIVGFLPMLRNHIYRVNIVSVKGSGYPDPDEAFDSKSQNMDVEILY
ncbi:MAG: Mfa1 fimbrilin C-terminal domain-containing protein [Rikenellaceae bacterium]|nr:Mfa1 fimbrilin C-terminal domain-containing protein [Rikenellaceae bacterium]